MMFKNSSHLIVYLCAIIAAGCGKKANKLTGSSAVIVEHYPFLVSVLWQGYHVCSGNIISEFYVITTATCVTNAKNVIYANLQVLSGTDYQNNFDGHGEINDVGLVIIHNDFAPLSFWANDICILQLETSMLFSMIRNKVNIFTPGLHRNKRHHYLLIGWQKFHVSSSEKMARADIHLKSTEDCEIFYDEEFGDIHNGQQCFSTVEETQKITYGDTGNPLLTFQKKNLYGLASLVPLEPNNNFFIATQVSVYSQWIRETLENV